MFSPEAVRQVNSIGVSAMRVRRCTGVEWTVFKSPAGENFFQICYPSYEDFSYCRLSQSTAIQVMEAQIK